MKIRYMKDKAKRQLDLEYEDISIHFFMCILAFLLNFKIWFWHRYIRLTRRTIEYKGRFFIKYAVSYRPPLQTFATINPHKRIKAWRARWVVKKFYFCSSKYFVIDALWIAPLSCWKISSPPHRRCPSCVSDKSFSIFT